MFLLFACLASRSAPRKIACTSMRKSVTFSPSSLARKGDSTRVAWPPGRCVPKWPLQKEPEEDDFDRSWRERKNKEDEAHCAGITLKLACGDSDRALRQLLKWRRRFRERNEEREPTAEEEDADPDVNAWKTRATQPVCKWNKRRDSFQYLGSSLNWPALEEIAGDPDADAYREVDVRMRRGELPAPAPFEGCRPPRPYLFYDTERAQYRCSAAPPNQSQLMAYLDNVLHAIDTTHPGASARGRYQREHGFVEGMMKERARLAASEVAGEEAGARAETRGKRPGSPPRPAADAEPPAKRSKKGGAPKRRQTRRRTRGVRGKPRRTRRRTRVHRTRRRLSCLALT